MSLINHACPISDFLQTQFGNTEIEVLFQDTCERYVYITTEQGMGLELARVCFKPAFNLSYPEVYQVVINGGFIGKTFRSKKIPFYRDIQNEYTALASHEISEAFNHARTIRVIEVDIYVGNSHTHVATITELYSSAVQWPEYPSFRELDTVLIHSFNNVLLTYKKQQKTAGIFT